MTKPITPIQQNILEFIQSYRQTHPFPPTLREICKEVKIKSTNGVRYHLLKLEKMGLLIRIEKCPRGVWVREHSPGFEGTIK